MAKIFFEYMKNFKKDVKLIKICAASLGVSNLVLNIFSYCTRNLLRVKLENNRDPQIEAL